MTYKDILEKVGLSSNEAKVYEALLRLGPSPASEIPKETNLSRPLVYKILEELFKKRIVDRDDTEKVTRFLPAHPLKLTELVEDKKQAAASAEASLQGAFGNLLSAYNLFSGKPHAQFYEGLAGLENLYRDILQEEKNILLFRSPSDNSVPEIEKLVVKQIRDQVKRGIKTRAITPLTDEHMKIRQDYDAENLVERSKIPKKDLLIPAQIIVYGEKVGITSFSRPIITTIIQDKAISETFRILFEFIWKQGVRD